MKRKRGVGKRKPKKPSVAGAADVPVDPGYYSDVNEENNGFGSRTEIESREVNTNMSGQHVGLDKPVINNKTVGGAAANLAWALSSSRTNRVPMQRETIGQKEPKSSQRDPVHKKQDLDAAQSVIKNIMEIDAAVPFNTPVDPIALGIPDYFDIVDTPMDFGTICSKLENGLKYRNSEEVFKDVQLIWDNCCKYNKEGSYIVELMKRVKNNFMKQWTAAGLYKEQQTVSNGHMHHNLQILAESTMRREGVGNMYSPASTMRHEEAGHMYRPASTMRHEDAEQMYRPASTMRHEDTEHMYRPASTTRHEDAEHLYPPASTMRHDEAGHMYRPASTMRHEDDGHMYPVGSTVNKSAYLGQHDWNQRQHQQLAPCYSHTFKPQQTPCCSHTQHDLAPQHNNFTHLNSVDPMNGRQWVNEAGPSLVHSTRPSPSCSFMGPPKQRAFMHQPSSSQLPPTQLHAGTDAHSSGHSHLPHREHAFSSRRYAIDGYHPHQYQMDPIHLQAYHPSASRMPVHQPNPSSFHQLQSSHVEGGKNIDYAGNMHMQPPTESTANCTKSGTEYPQAPVTDKTSCQNLDQINSSPEQLSSSMANIEACQPLERTCQNQPESSPSERLHSTADNNFSKRNTRGQGLAQCQEQLSPMMNSQEHQPPEIVIPQSQPSPPAVDYTSNLKKKNRGRGPTIDVPIREGERIPVAINQEGQPVGPKAIKLVTYLGTLARNGHYAPLIYLDWRAVPMENKEKMWEKIQSRFDIDPMSKDWLMRSISWKWRDWKAKLKIGHYYPYETDEERLAHCNERVLPDQWAVLVKLWNTEEMQKCSARNRANKMKQKYKHATGRKSFARIREEQKAIRPDGKEPSRAELFIMTRTRKNGKPINEASSEVITRLRDRAKDQNTPEDNNKQSDVLLEIIGSDKKGRPRCLELGPSPADFGGLKRSHAETIRMVTEANSEIREVKEKMAIMEQTCAQMASQMAAMMSMMSSMHKNMPDKNMPDMAAISSSSSDHSAPQLPHNKQTPSEGSTRQTRQSKQKI